MDTEELKMNGQASDQESEEEEVMEGDTNWFVKEMLKNHAIDLMTRMNPGKRGYYKLVWEKITLDEIFEYKLERVFIDR